MIENKNQKLWNDFRLSFKKNIEESFELSHLKTRIEKKGERKYFLKYDIFPLIAKDMGMVYKEDEEFLRVDYTFYKKGLHGFEVPQIFIESENNWDSTDQEITKLCSLNAPLKILIVYDLTEEEVIDSYWDYIFPDFIDENRLIGQFSIIVCNWTDKLRFYTLSYDFDGKKIENWNLLVER